MTGPLENLVDLKYKMLSAASLVRTIEDSLQRARTELHNAERAYETSVSRSAEPEDKNLTTEDLRERIANYARAHETGETDLWWRLFRRSLAVLAQRAEGKT
jgi:hypothetical protein